MMARSVNVKACLCLLIAFLLFACSLPPQRKVTEREFTRLKIGRFFECYNSTEEILEYLNRDGEVTFECYTKGKNKAHYYLQVLSAHDGLSIKMTPVEE